MFLKFRNEDKREFLGRTGESWAKIGAFYFVFYACLAGFFAICLSLFFLTIDNDRPKLTGMDSLLKNNPGMSYEPNFDPESSLIEAHSENPEDTKPYLQMEKFLKKYQPNPDDDVPPCSGANDTDDSECRFSVKMFDGTPCSQANKFGYGSKKPCVALMLNRIFNWQPELYEAGEGNDEIKDRTDGNNIIVHCYGEDPLDRELMGEVEFYPKGFHKKFYPYTSKKGYQSPIVMAQFKSINPRTLVQIQCKAWAKNIKHHDNDKAGSVHFEVITY